jgi:hypothetical protein
MAKGWNIIAVRPNLSGGRPLQRRFLVAVADSRVAILAVIVVDVLGGWGGRGVVRSAGDCCGLSLVLLRVPFLIPLTIKLT